MLCSASCVLRSSGHFHRIPCTTTYFANFYRRARMFSYHMWGKKIGRTNGLLSFSRWLEHTPRRKTTRKVHARRIVKKALFSGYVAEAYCISVRLLSGTNVMHRPWASIRLLCSTTFVPLRPFLSSSFECALFSVTPFSYIQFIPQDRLFYCI